MDGHQAWESNQNFGNLQHGTDILRSAFLRIFVYRRASVLFAVAHIKPAIVIDCSNPSENMQLRTAVSGDELVANNPRKKGLFSSFLFNLSFYLS